MTQYNSIKPFRYFLYLILLIVTGCAEKTSKHVFINEIPPGVSPDFASTSIVSTDLNKERQHHTKLPDSKELSRLDDGDGKTSHQSSQAVHHNNIWTRLVSLYSLPVIENERINHELKKFLKNPEYLTTIQKRAEPYLYFILEEIEAKQIPGELALLPAIESAFKPTAVSRSLASGLWQFMPATGRLFKLKQNWWYDARNDVVSSTQAATDYLKQLSKTFDDDWLLALAAYNAGKGTVRKRINRNLKKNLPTDYWSLPLPKETQYYVPKLLALAKIFANPSKYNISLESFPNKAYFKYVKLDSPIDLGIATKMAGMTENEFFNLNPGYKRFTTDPDGPYHLLIPVDKAEIFEKKLALTSPKDRIKWIRHIIKEGENLGNIAIKYHTTVNALRYSNRLANNKIRAGNFLLIPDSFYKTRPSQQRANKHYYTVKKGDTFWYIARLFSVRSRDIANWNNISLTKILRPGQKLIIKKS